MPDTVLDILTDALQEIGVLNAVDPPSGEDAALALRRFNRLLDDKNAERAGVYASAIASVALTPALQPHTIGASGATWTVTQRPESIEAANLVVDDIRYPVWVRDRQWWMSLADPETTGEYPTDLYYEPAWPLGKVYLYPVPTVAHDVELLTRLILADMAQSDTFTLPPGYKTLLTLELAEDLTTPFRMAMPPTTARKLMEARARVYGNHDRVPHISTRDSGVPSGGRGSYDYQTRIIR